MGHLLRKRVGLFDLVYVHQNRLLKMGVGSISYKIYDVCHWKVGVGVQQLLRGTSKGDYRESKLSKLCFKFVLINYLVQDIVLPPWF